ncbi:probable peptidoglycan muropeptide transporter SLC46 [Drosophila suzukii]|uniref:Probable peptidoglycan muropeptide transporter SLC46 n=1 Tax=Drosophila suzukii TaxID=28584 RepID=A0AB39Z358_DROSZ
MVEKASSAFTLEKLRNLQWQKVFHMFYIEPVVFMLLFSHTLSGTIQRNQVIYQTCTVIFHYNESDCKQLDVKNASAEINAIETELQPYVANLFLSRTLLESIVPAFCGLFIGSWSDHYGRKPLLIVSMIGFSASFLMMAAICELSSYYVVNPWWYILAAVPHSLLGGNCVFSVAAFCFISDITDCKSRPYRMIFMESLFFIGLTSGSLLSSFVYAAVGSAATIGLSGCIVTFATFFIIFFVPESLHYHQNQATKNAIAANGEKDCKEKEVPITACDLQLDRVAIDCPPNFMDTEEPEKDKKMELPTPATPAMSFDDDLLAKYVERLPQKAAEEELKRKQAEERSKKAGLFSFVHIRDMISTCFKRRDHHARAIIWLVTLAMFLSIFVFDGVMTVMYLFVREKFHWTVRDYTFFETVSHLVPMIGALIGFLILRKVFRLSVVTLALLAFFSEILNNLAKGFATMPWHMYLSVTLGVFRSISGPMCRTIVSNIVPPSDLGKIFSIKNVLQSFAPFVAAPLYTLIYKRSLTTYPGLFNFVSSFLYLLSFVFIGYVLRIKYRHKDHYAKVLK